MGVLLLCLGAAWGQAPPGRAARSDDGRADVVPRHTTRESLTGSDQLGSDGVASKLAAMPWRAITRSHSCGGLPNAVLRVVTRDVSGDGVPDAVVLARCDTPTGTMPSQLYVFTPTPLSERPHLLDTLMDGQQWQASSVLVDGRQIITWAARSSPGVPNCCPDIHRKLTWRWDGTGFRRFSG